MEPKSRRAFLGMTGAAAAGVSLYGVSTMAAHNATVPEAQVMTGTGANNGTLTPFKDALRIPPVLRPHTSVITEITSVMTQVRLHSELPPTPMWTYQGHYPGPTIEARKGKKIRVAWTNRLNGTIPVKGVWCVPVGAAPGLEAYNTPGSAGTRLRNEVANLTAWTSTHLHGNHQHAVSDGGTDIGVTPGGSQLADYPNQMAAAQYFYHDHAMPVTALNVYAGLVGQYIVRDTEEDRLGLPKGKYEIPLALSDVNFETDVNGRLTGELLVKRVSGLPLDQITDEAIPPSVAFLGPYTMVNGVVWPHLDVEAHAYRFRIVNTALARTYRLVVVDEATGKPVPNAMKLVGTDLGLLDHPRAIEEGLSLSPAERADVVIDFAAFHGRRLTLVNTVAGVPAGTPVPPAAVAYPQIMQFRVATRAAAAYRLPTILSASFRRLTLDAVPQNTPERFALTTVVSGMPVMWELKEVPDDSQLGNGIVQIRMPTGLRTLRRTGAMFEDTTAFFAASGSWEKWHFIGTAGPPHPMHIHQMNFQIVDRRSVDASGLDLTIGGTRTPITVGSPLPVAPEETGWKDTITVAPNSLVTVAGRYGDFAGRFMYHCHLLDHEDEGMMRPLVILPQSALELHHRMAGMHAGMTGHQH
ncbi:multicopper oxidase domain-containing protein [Micromonospora ureilytica]|uniref:multicopper oxidase family protein n=1 Tax=Micromonospora ureilytica TaxID=709868 RepID=UPI0033DDB5AB